MFNFFFFYLRILFVIAPLPLMSGPEPECLKKIIKKKKKKTVAFDEKSEWVLLEKLDKNVELKGLVHTFTLLQSGWTRTR